MVGTALRLTIDRYVPMASDSSSMVFSVTLVNAARTLSSAPAYSMSFSNMVRMAALLVLLNMALTGLSTSIACV